MKDILDGKYVGPLTIPEVIEQFKYRGGIHLSYIELNKTNFAYETYGTTEYHLWAINGYEEGIRHLEGRINTQIVFRCSILEVVKTIAGTISKLFKRNE